MANGQWGGLKTVISAVTVSQEIEAQLVTFPRLAEAWDALEWVLARSAAAIGRAPNGGNQNLRLYVQAGDALANVPAIWVVYSVGEEIEILAVKIVFPTEDDDQEV